jgi:hypothetical protein
VEEVRRGVDFSQRAADWNKWDAALKATGRDFIGRYIATTPDYIPHDWRVLTKQELATHLANGVSVFAYWENSPDHVADHTRARARDGFAAGANDARQVVAMMEYLGHPHTPAMYCIDTDLTGPAVRAYFMGIGSVVPKAEIGVYGGMKPVSYLFDEGLITYACQTKAWSYGHWDERAQIHQFPTGSPMYQTIGGIACDLLDLVKEPCGFFGGAPVPQPIPIPGEDDMYGDQDRLRDAYTAVRVLSNQFDIAILEAKVANNPAEVARLEAKKAVDVANERKTWGL